MYYLDNGAYPSSDDSQVTSQCTGTALYTELVGGGYLTEMITDPSENILSCSLNRNSDDTEFYYGYDTGQITHSRKHCFGIQNFESGTSSLENINQQGEVSFAGGGGLSNADFVYCFEQQ